MRVKKGLVLRHIGEEHVIVVPNRGYDIRIPAERSGGMAVETI